jgi:hypothetical protein
VNPDQGRVSPASPARPGLAPTLLVGVGGTGVEVLLRLRRLFHDHGIGDETGPGYPVIGYLALDTDAAAFRHGIADLSDSARREIRLREEGDNPEALDCSLRPQDLEQYFAGGPQQFPHVFCWLPQELRRLAGGVVPATGQNRLLGRLAFFHHYSKIKRALAEKISTVVAYSRSPELLARWKPAGLEVDSILFRVVVVYSLAGGAGGGMFLDVGMLVRQVVEQTPLRMAHHFTHIAVLPEPFVRGLRWHDPDPAEQEAPARQMQVNAFAALREMEYFSSRGGSDCPFAIPPPSGAEREPLYTVRWKRDGTLHRIDSPPWDTCYLLGGRNDALGLEGLSAPEVHQVIAEHLFLDFDAGAFGAHKRSLTPNSLQHSLTWMADTVADEQGRELYRRRLSRRFSTFGLARVSVNRDRLRRAAGCRLAWRLIRELWLRQSPYSPAELARMAAMDLGDTGDRTGAVTRTALPDDPLLALDLGSIVRQVSLIPGETNQTWWQRVEEEAARLQKEIESGVHDSEASDPILAWVQGHVERLRGNSETGTSTLGNVPTLVAGSPKRLLQAGTTPRPAGEVWRCLAEQREKVLALAEARARCLFLFRVDRLGIAAARQLFREYAALTEKALHAAEQPERTPFPVSVNVAPDGITVMHAAEQPERTPFPGAELQQRLHEARRLPLYARKAARWELLRCLDYRRRHLLARYWDSALQEARPVLERLRRRFADAGTQESYPDLLLHFWRLLEGKGSGGVLPFLVRQFEELRGAEVSRGGLVSLVLLRDEGDYDRASSKALALDATSAATPDWPDVERQVLEQLRNRPGPWERVSSLGELILVLGEPGARRRQPADGAEDLAQALAEACAATLVRLDESASVLAWLHGLDPEERGELLRRLVVYSTPYLLPHWNRAHSLGPVPPPVVLLGVAESTSEDATRLRAKVEAAALADHPLSGNVTPVEVRDDSLLLYQERVGLPLCAYAGLEQMGALYDRCDRLAETHLDYPALGWRLPEIRVLDPATQRKQVACLELTLVGIMTGVLRWDQGRFRLGTRRAGLVYPLGSRLEEVVAAGSTADEVRTELQTQVDDWLDRARAEGSDRLALLWGAAQNLADEISRRVEQSVDPFDAPEGRSPVLAILTRRLLPRLRRLLEGSPDGGRWLLSPLDREELARRVPSEEDRQRVLDEVARLLRRCYDLLSEELPIPVLRPDARLLLEDLLRLVQPVPPAAGGLSAGGAPTEQPAPELSPPSEADSPRLRHAIENKFPYPLARAFAQLRGIDHWLAEVPQLANVVGIALQHLAFLALAEYLAGPARDDRLNRAVTDALQKPVSHGTWAGLLRQVLTFLRDQGVPPFVTELREFYFPADGARTVETLKEMSDELVELRNDLVKRSADSLPARAKYQRFKRGTVAFLQAVGFLKDYPLVSVASSHSQEGIKTHLCQLHAGFRDAFEVVPVQCDLDLEGGRVALLSPRGGEVLSVHPFYLLRPCPEEGCGDPHLFRLDRAEKNRLEYVSAGGHRLRDQAAAAEFHAALLAPQGSRRRQQARYLYLGATEVQQRRLPGERIKGRYEIVEHLRAGGMADVYKVKCLATGALRALKLLPYSFLTDRTLIQRFRQEALQAQKLQHPNIVGMLEYDEDLTDHFLVMELAPGWPRPDGGRALDAGELPRPLPRAVAVAVAQQACAGLDCLHQHNLIHRDVKPGNLLLFDDGVVKLGDFGIARTREALTLTLTGLAVGTPEYMSPEQADGKDELTPASDLYSLGVVLYELLTGVSPFRRKTAVASAHAHLHEQPPPPRTLNPDLPEGLQDVVLRCIEKEPARRYRSARELYEALHPFRDGPGTV